jgi:hypothetical protein
MYTRLLYVGFTVSNTSVSTGTLSFVIKDKYCRLPRYCHCLRNVLAECNVGQHSIFEGTFEMELATPGLRSFRSSAAACT